jgi:hypothetical protein
MEEFSLPFCTCGIYTRKNAKHILKSGTYLLVKGVVTGVLWLWAQGKVRNAVTDVEVSGREPREAWHQDDLFASKMPFVKWLWLGNKEFRKLRPVTVVTNIYIYDTSLYLLSHHCVYFDTFDTWLFWSVEWEVFLKYKKLYVCDSPDDGPGGRNMLWRERVRSVKINTVLR